MHIKSDKHRSLMNIKHEIKTPQTKDGLEQPFNMTVIFLKMTMKLSHGLKLFIRSKLIYSMLVFKHQKSSNHS